jgi:DNA-binding IclR family transcriptional regulator
MTVARNLQRYRVHGLARGLALLECLVGSTDGLSLSDLATRIGVGKVSTLRILATLESAGFVVRDRGSARYRLSFRLGSLAARHYESLGPRQAAEPILHQLSRNTGELAEFAMVSGETRMVVVAAIEGTHRVRVEPARPGRVVPPHATALGKAWIAQLPDAKALRICRRHGLRRYTSRTITSVTDLRKELRATRSRGYAVSRGEWYEGTLNVGVPVMSQPPREGSCLGALVLVLPLSRAVPGVEHELARMLGKAAVELSACLAVGSL